mgnify:CR=1 FL=1
MTIRHRVSLEGGEELSRKWRQASDRLAKPVATYWQKATRQIRTQAIEYTPVERGLLQSSYMIHIGSEKVPDEASIYNPVRYAGPLEHKEGARPRRTGRIPFFRPAIAKSAGAIRRWGKDLLREFREAMQRR